MSRISEYRRETILNAALAEFGTRGIEGASISEIAARAGIGKSTIYEYFTSKSELFFAVCKMKARQIMEEVCAVFAQDIPFASQLEHYVRMMLCLTQEVDMSQILRMVGNESLSELREMVEQLWTQMAAATERAVQRAQSAGELAADLDAPAAAAYFLSIPNPYFIYRMKMLGREDPARTLVELAMRGMQSVG